MSRPPKPANQTPVDQVLAALVDPTRRQAFELLVDNSPATATGLSAVLGVSRQAASKHLLQLVDSGLASTERSGRETLYRADTAGLEPLVTWADQTAQLWSRRLDRLSEM